MLILKKKNTCPIPGTGPEYYEVIPCPTGGIIRLPMNAQYKPCTEVPCLSPNLDEGIVPCDNVTDDVWFVK